jgi:hypothetical protein
MLQQFSISWYIAKPRPDSFASENLAALYLMNSAITKMKSKNTVWKRFQIL